MSDEMRKQFEEVYPCPIGGYWHDVQGTYVGPAGWWELQEERWKAWQASRSYLHTIVMKPILEEIISAGVKKIVFQTELLAAAERYLEFRHHSDIGFGTEYSGVHPQTELKNAIAKAKGELT